LLRHLRQFLKLDRERQRLFLQAWPQLGAVRWALRRRPFKELVAEFTAHRPPYEPEDPGPEALAQARRIGWAVAAAARFTPWRSTCLVQVLAAQRMLQPRLIPGAICIGAAPGEAAGAGLEAHAWLKCGAAVVCGESGHQRYAVVAVFSWS